MRVESASIAMQSQHEALEKTERRETLQARIGERAPSAGNPPAAPLPDILTLSPRSQAVQPTRAEALPGGEENLSPHDRLVLDILKRVFKALTGKEMKLFSPEELGERIAKTRQQSAEFTARLETTRISAGFSLSYDYYESHYEYEAVSFSAEGTIKTQDGREIQFSVRLNLSREFYTEHRESLRLGDAAKTIDPLVVNFDGNAAELGDTRFEFDLDADVRSEQLALLKPGSAFLALDRNGDGVINDGRELFGAATGNGFRELAVFDEDDNHFIDEGDPIYNRLRLWLHDNSGGQQLIGLGEKGIGAIFLGHIASPFRLRNAANDALGEVAASGLFLRQDGESGTIQQVNYVA